MPMSRTAQSLVLNENIFEDIFAITRATNILPEDKVAQLAKIVVKNQLGIKPLVAEIIARDRTGYKEVVGQITKLTGFGLSKLCSNQKHFSQLEAFSEKDFCKERNKAWEAAVVSFSN